MRMLYSVLLLVVSLISMGVQAAVSSPGCCDCKSMWPSLFTTDATPQIDPSPFRIVVYNNTGYNPTEPIIGTVSLFLVSIHFIYQFMKVLWHAKNASLSLIILFLSKEKTSQSLKLAHLVAVSEPWKCLNLDHSLEKCFNLDHPFEKCFILEHFLEKMHYYRPSPWKVLEFGLSSFSLIAL